jgi:GBP family porin
MNRRLKPVITACLYGVATPFAWAQSTGPTVYVVVDVEVNSMRAGQAAGGKTLTRIEDGTALGLAGSRLGFRAVEDLGSGLHAGFVLESGILADTGAVAQGGRGFGRQAFVSLGHRSYGELRMGRQYMLGDTVTALGLPFGGAMVTKTSTAVSGPGITALPVWIDAARADRIIQYMTPVWAGVSAGAQYAPGEGLRDNFHALMSAYRSGPVVAGLSYEWNKDRVTGRSSNRLLGFGGSYTFSKVKVGASAQRGRNLTSTSGNGEAAGFTFALPASGASAAFTATRFDGVQLSFEIPHGLFTFGGQWLQGRFSNDSGGAMTFKRPGVGLTYALSKQTALYTGFSYVIGDLKDHVNQQRVINAGIRTSF